MPVVPANLRAALTALAAFAAFSSHDVLVKTLGGRYAPAQILFFSVLLSFPLFSFALVQSGKAGSLRPRRPLWTLLRTGAVMVTGLSAFTAFSLLPLAQTYALLFATPMMITLLSIPVLGEKVGLHRGAAVLVGLIGVMIVLRPGSTDLSLGHLAGLTAALGSATGSIVVRKIGREERSAVLMLFPLLANTAVMGAAMPWVYRPMPVGDLGLMAAIAGLSLVATAAMINAYKVGEAVVVAPMQYSQIVWAAVFGWLIFDDLPDTPTLVGAGIVIASGIYILGRESGGRVSLNKPVLRSRARVVESGSTGLPVPEPTRGTPPEQDR